MHFTVLKNVLCSQSVVCKPVSAKVSGAPLIKSGMHIKCELVGKHTTTMSRSSTLQRAFGVRQSDHAQRGLLTDLGGEMARHLMKGG